MSDVVWAQFRSRAGRPVERPVHQLSAERLEERAGVWEPPRYRGRRAITTWWRPADRAGHVGCATLGALQAAISLEFDPQVTAFASWPVRLFRVGSTDGYVPDFFARLRDGQACLVVRRPSGGAATGDAWGRALKLVTTAGEQAGWQVRVHGSDDAVVARNRQRLARYRHTRMACPDTARVLRDVFAGPRPFDAGIQASGLPPMRTAACGLHLIWRGELLIDWSRPFTPGRSLVWTGQEAT
ncbi:TnsA-like heteromeric transposase endonuclease subunit [Streptomyces rubiginosohelvolus]|uniref:TnsA-like heteromeric transposase endonuclease subunit n=1 Tax=Streptomyces rubiginosohelvolus TaxID=67362 RepID=UPI003829D406